MSRVVIDIERQGAKIDRNIYGHFSEHLGRCIYEGIWVGEKSKIPNVRGIRKDVVQALKKIKVPVLRWPGGCFADEYHWQDGIGPRKKRPSMVNTHWGGVTENNHFGTHEFLDLCEQLECAPYICGNVGSGTVREMQEWVEYVTFDGISPMTDLRRANGRKKPWKLPYFGVGNENWGCGGSMRPEYYADLYRRYQTYVRNFAGNRVFKIACGASDDNYHWTDVLMREAWWMMHGLSLHMYCFSGKQAIDIAEADWFRLLKRAFFMNELLERHSAVMDRYDPGKRVALIVDEWGAWHSVEPDSNPGFLYQQNTLRDALLAAVTLNIFNQHCARVRMANIAQTVNVLQAVILTRGPKMVLTPTYHVFDLFSVHQDAVLLPADLECDQIGTGEDKIPAVSVSASRNAAGEIHVSLCNLAPSRRAEVNLKLRGVEPKEISGRVLTADMMQAHNTFEKPESIQPADFKGASRAEDGVKLTLPPKSVAVLKII